MAALAVFMTSCKDDKNQTVTPDPPRPSAWYLTTVISRDVESGELSDMKDSMVITYNADKVISSLEETVEPNAVYYAMVKLQYDQLKVTKLTTQDSKTGTAKTEYECRYAGNNLVRFFHPGEADINYDSLVYDNDKIVKVLQVRAEKRNQKRYDYTWQGNNVTTEKEFRPNATNELELSFIRTFTYNEVPNPMRPMSNYFLMQGDNPNVAYLSANELNTRSEATPDSKVFDIYKYTRAVNDLHMTAVDTFWRNNIAAGTTVPVTISHYKYTDLSK